MSFAKFAYVRSKSLMQAYRLIPCQACGRDDGTVCGAHSNEARHGKGRSIKASDQFAASLCANCHYQLDQGAHLTRAERVSMWTSAHIKTIHELCKRQIWPDGVPIPETSKVTT